MAESNTNKGKFTQDYPTERKNYADLHQHRGRLENDAQQSAVSEQPVKGKESSSRDEVDSSKKKSAA